MATLLLSWFCFLLLLGGGGLVLYLVKQSVARNDFLNPTADWEGINKYASTGIVSKVVLGLIGFLLLYGFLSLLA
jgi:hypothetical protein